MAKVHIRKGDTVIILSGDDKGVKGEVIAVSPGERKAIVKGVNIIHKHVKPRRQGEAGGIVEAEGAVYTSKMALYCPKCRKGVRTRVEVGTAVDKNGRTIKTKVRVCAGKDKDGNPCGYRFE